MGNFLFAFAAVILLLYSSYRMKIFLEFNKDQSWLRLMFPHPGDERKVIVKFFQSMIKNKDKSLNKKYMWITFFYIVGLILLFSVIVAEIKFGLS